MKKVNLAIVGATGMVGRTFLKVLEERNFPIDNLFLFSSAKSAGSKVNYAGKEYTVEELTQDSFTNRGIQIALFSAGGTISEKFAPIASSNGVLVIDNSSHWRMDPDVPLVIPEVNPEAIKNHKGIIANPNCSTIQALVPLKPLDDKYKIKRVIYSTYQAVSGSGVKGVEDLEKGMEGNPTGFYPHQISYNCLPHIDSFTENGYTKEELKMINETMKILNNYDLKVTATTVRVPVKNGHSESINVEFEKSFELSDLVSSLNSAPGVVVVDNPANNEYPTAFEVDGSDEVFVGRIRRDFSIDNGINLWVVADNIRKGAATNTIQIAEKAIEYDLV
ncbi:aspartate-semialdehyde dehydrogenase [Metaclostridioides mangenotii]|jgi:aspartate-semialdehyde dehydrogenase|uniref:Aspartate-semialdehyde dehydrogenase n=1 Tax=Metaclostridioides mangenotii TaxID=1540 RepID=A0ABS4EAP8_9FIRM|nr:aspartate-semialdehyde dehydrogenase [Clostridioides mangenotii]MBP1855015.1 aspartate-semialdehyde dehydrogenase [Clostridioides mangenotii]